MSARKVLVWTLRREAQHDRSLAEIEARAGLGLWRRRHSLERAQTLRHDVDALGWGTDQRHEVGACALRDRDHAVGAAHGERHEHAHPHAAHTGVRLGVAGVDQVVHRHDAPEASPRRCGAPQAVQEVNTLAGRQAREMQLLARHPLHTIASAHGDGHDPHAIGVASEHVARLRTGLRGLAVDERREAHSGGRSEQGGQQLARGDLHAPGLSRHEEDQVQADVRRARAQGRERLAASSPVADIGGKYDDALCLPR